MQQSTTVKKEGKTAKQQSKKALASQYVIHNQAHLDVVQDS